MCLKSVVDTTNSVYKRLVIDTLKECKIQILTQNLSDKIQNIWPHGPTSLKIVVGSLLKVTFNITVTFNVTATFNVTVTFNVRVQFLFLQKSQKVPKVSKGFNRPKMYLISRSRTERLFSLVYVWKVQLGFHNYSRVFFFCYLLLISIELSFQPCRL